jgi:hypothetical protein
MPTIVRLALPQPAPLRAESFAPTVSQNFCYVLRFGGRCGEVLTGRGLYEIYIVAPLIALNDDLRRAFLWAVWAG